MVVRKQVKRQSLHTKDQDRDAPVLPETVYMLVLLNHSETFHQVSELKRKRSSQERWLGDVLFQSFICSVGSFDFATKLTFPL